jgi:hypothetical protein
MCGAQVIGTQWSCFWYARTGVSGWQQPKIDCQEHWPIDPRMSHHPDRSIPRALDGPRHDKQGEPEDEHDPQAKAEVKGAVKKALMPVPRG